MRHVRLGGTGLRVSQLCLGTMTFGLQCDEPTSVAILDRAAAGGITFLEALRPLAAEAGMSMAQMAVAWVLENPAVTSPIVGASRPEQLDDSLAAVDKGLDESLKARLDELTREYRWGDDIR